MGPLPLALALLLYLATAGAAAAALPQVPRAELATSTGTTQTLAIELARTPSEWNTGLMNRPSMPEDTGMLFIFPEDVSYAFYMANTLIPLSVAWIDSSGTIVDIQDMQPLTEDLHYSRKPYRWALEVNQGYFTRHGVAIGDRVSYWDRRAFIPLTHR